MNYTTDDATAVKSFTRPRYFYGQLLDVRHFESEQDYFRRKIHLLNQMVSGYGVVCGLDVKPGPDDHSVVVEPGLALDKWGHEIVVPCHSKKVPIESMPPADATPKPPENRPYNQQGGDDCGPDNWVHLVICYSERNADPEPVFSGGCEPQNGGCTHGAVRELYELKLVPGRAQPISVDSMIPGLIKGNTVNYRALCNWVSEPCDHHEDPCITLANVRRPPANGVVDQNDIDICVRPIVFSLDLLWELVLALTHETYSRRTPKG
jgi:hypothetical protein